MKYQEVKNYIGGKFVEVNTNKRLDVISPVDGTLLSKVPMSSAKDLDEAVKAAKAAFPAWSKMPIKERVQIFFRYKTLSTIEFRFFLRWSTASFHFPCFSRHLFWNKRSSPSS